MHPNTDPPIASGLIVIPSKLEQLDTLVVYRLCLLNYRG